MDPTENMRQYFQPDGSPEQLPNGGVDVAGRCLRCGEQVQSSGGCGCCYICGSRPGQPTTAKLFCSRCGNQPRTSKARTTMNIRVGSTITHNGHEWHVVALGDWGVRCQRGYGDNLSVIVLRWIDLA